MKKIFIILGSFIVIVIFLFVVKIPEYVELNNLVIVESIGVQCSDNKYRLYFKEIIPLKDDNGINYKYKIYSSSDFKKLGDAYDDIKGKSNKKIFYKKAKYLVTNCKKSITITDYFKLNPRYIEHISPNSKIENVIQEK